MTGLTLRKIHARKAITAPETVLELE